MKKTIGEFKSGLGLKSKTLLFIVGITTIPLALLVWGIFTGLTQASLEVEDKALAQTTELIRQEFLNNVAARADIYDLTFKNLIIGLDAFKDVAVDPDQLAKALGDFERRNNAVSRAYFTDGAVIAADPAAHPVGFDFVGAAGRIYTGQWFGPYVTAGNAIERMTYGLPVWDGQTLRGVIAFDITIDSILQEVVDIDPSQTSYVVLVRGDGQAITYAEGFRDDFAVPAGSTNILESPYAEQLGLAQVITTRNDTLGSVDLPDPSGVSRKMAVYAYIPTFGARVFVISPLDELLQVQREKVADIRAGISRVAVASFFWLLLLGAFITAAVYGFSDVVVIRPLRRLMTGVVDLEQVNFDRGTTVPIVSHDELGALASRFNVMAERLRDSYEGLERKVEERTAEIRKNLSEIERLNKFMVGREVRMRELKNELAKLKGEPAPPDEKPKGEKV